MLLNLEFAIKCDAYIGTLASNWCRLVDELRATVGEIFLISDGSPSIFDDFNSIMLHYLSDSTSLHAAINCASILSQWTNTAS